MSERINRAAVAALTKTLPPDAAYRVAARFSGLFLRGKEARLRRDTAELFPDKPAPWVAARVREQRVHRAWSALDKVVLSKMSGDEVLARCDPGRMRAGRDILDGVLAEGNGGIVYTLHYGRPVLAPLALTHLGYPYVALVGGTTTTNFDRPMLERFKELGAEVIDAGDVTSGVHAMRTLRRNKLFFLLVDGRVTERQTSVNFFGRSVPLSLGFAQLAQRTGAAVVAGVTHSTAPLGFRFDATRVHLPDRSATIEEIAPALLAPLEAAVRADVGQWYGINRLFRLARNAREGGGRPNQDKDE